MDRFKNFSSSLILKRNLQKLDRESTIFYDGITAQLETKTKPYLSDYKDPLLILGKTEKILFAEDAAITLNKVMGLSLQPQDMQHRHCRLTASYHFPIWTYQNYFIEIGYTNCRYGIYDPRLPVFVDIREKQSEKNNINFFPNMGFVIFLTYIFQVKNNRFSQEIVTNNIVCYGLHYYFDENNDLKVFQYVYNDPKKLRNITQGDMKEFIDLCFSSYQKPFSWDELVDRCKKDYQYRKQKYMKDYPFSREFFGDYIADEEVFYNYYNDPSNIIP